MKITVKIMSKRVGQIGLIEIIAKKVNYNFQLIHIFVSRSTKYSVQLISKNIIDCSESKQS